MFVETPDALEVLMVDGREIRITHSDKLYFSRQVKISKLEMVRYYLSVSPGALAGIADRPIVLKRFVDGAEREAFYQKRAPRSALLDPHRGFVIPLRSYCRRGRCR